MDTNSVAQLIATLQQPKESNTWFDYILIVLVILAGFVVGRILKQAFEKAAARSAEAHPIQSRAMNLASRTAVFPSAVIGICIALRILAVPPDLLGLRANATAVLLILAVTYLAYQAVELLDFWMRRFAARTGTTLDDMMVPLVRKTLRCVVVLLGLAQTVQQLSDQPISSILAGLGVGGLAVALAAQDTIKNFFGSLVIFADHPFQVGNRITSGEVDGVVEEVGMRSTRIRNLDGHLLTIPNGELANRTICNISQRPYIKRVANITVTYDTPPEKVERAMAIIREAIDRRKENLHPDFPVRVVFNNFNAASLNILVIYWFAPPDYWEFMAFDEAFNLEILRRFNEEGIEFAFPTQTLYLAGDPNRPLNPR